MKEWKRSNAGQTGTDQEVVKLTVQYMCGHGGGLLGSFAVGHRVV